MSERPRFEVNSKGEAYDVGIRDLRNKLHPLLEEAKNIAERVPELAGRETDLIVALLQTEYDLDELEVLAQKLESISANASHIAENGSQTQAFMQGEINWLQLVETASKTHTDHIRRFTEELSKEDI